MSRSGSKKNVLLVEDNPEDEKLVVWQLEDDFQSFTVNSLEKVEPALDKRDFDIILLDLTLPDSEGLETLSAVRTIAPNIPIVVITGADDKEMAVQAVREGAQDYLFKGAVDRHLLANSLRYGIERHRTQKELERSNQELARFAYIISHDLQSPLRGIRTFTEVLAEEYEGKLDSEADEYIRIITKCATKAQLLISELLAFSRVQSKKQTFNSFQFSNVIDETRNSLAAEIAESKATIKCDKLPKITADNKQMVQLMTNLISNAIKFKGKAPPKIHISAKRNNGDWVFSIKDNGIGILEKDFVRVFEVFQRLHRPDDYPGTGIGLAISKKLLERHQGRLWVESEIEKGSVFHFTLPADREESK